MSENFDLQKLLYGEQGSEEITLPSGRLATVREMTGLDQRNFMNRTKLNNGMAIQELLMNCIDTIDGEPLPDEKKERLEAVLNLLAGDRQALLFGIRRFSLGETFQFKTKCPNPECKHEGEWEVDLSDKANFAVIPYKLGNGRQLEYESQKKPGLKLRLNLLDGHAEMRVIRNRATADMLTDLEARQPHAYDAAGDRWVPVNLSKVGDLLIGEMRKVLREHEGQVDTTVTVVCDHCSEEVRFDLLQIPDFLIPSVIS